MTRLFLMAGAALLLAGCEVRNGAAAGESSGPSASTLSKAEAEKIVSAAHSAFLGGDAFKIMEHYAPGAVMFDPGNAEPSSDRNTQTQWSTEFVGMKPADLVSNPFQIQLLDADTFVASGIASFTGDIGGHRDLYHARYSQVFEKQPDGRWLIVHEHMSMPPAPSGGQ